MTGYRRPARPWEGGSQTGTRRTCGSPRGFSLRTRLSNDSITSGMPDFLENLSPKNIFMQKKSAGNPLLGGADGSRKDAIMNVEQKLADLAAQLHKSRARG